MRKLKYSDEEFLEGFRTGNDKIIKAFSKIVFPHVLKYIRKFDGSFNDAKDITQDGFEVLFEKSLKENFDYHGNLMKYYLGICRNKWWKSVEQEQRAHVYDVNHTTVENPDRLPEKDQLEIMDKIMNDCINTLEKLCREIISFRLKGKSYEFIAEQLNIGSSKRARDQRYRCVRKLNDLVVNHNLYPNLSNE